MENKLDYIVIGGGLGGLTCASFLAKQSKNVLVVEKHDKPGGYVTSFDIEGCTFDSGVFHSPNLAKDDFIAEFLKYLGTQLPAEPIDYRIRHYMNDQVIEFDAAQLPDILKTKYPAEAASIDTFFDIAQKIIDERISIGPPSPPYEMSLLQKLMFGMKALIKMPINMKFMAKPAIPTLKGIFADSELLSTIYALDPVPIFFLSPLFTWRSLGRREFFYPKGGMQKLPNCFRDVITACGSEIRLRCEAEKILFEKNKAIGILTRNGEKIFAGTVICNAPIHHTLNYLCSGQPQFESLKKRIKSWKVHISTMMIFVGVDLSFDFGNRNWISLCDRNTIDIPSQEITPENCAVHVLPQPYVNENGLRSVLIPAYIPYEYSDNWGTGSSKTRNENYRKVKEEAAKIVMGRVCEKLGPRFRNAVRFSVSATPLTFERYTYNEKGACLGWFMDKDYFAHQLPPELPTQNLFYVGQYSFPGGGVPGVIYNGYLLAKKLLMKDGIDLATMMKQQDQKL